ncbi:MAG: hypothetical protein O7G32_13580, partial [SAR324 cluster bacterium]|nr:hypothetical protein [SAR324 cluster bacterium]
MSGIVRCTVRWMLLFSLAVIPWAAAWGGESTAHIQIKMYEMGGSQLLYEGSRQEITGDETVTVRTQYRKPGGKTIQSIETVYGKRTLELVSHQLEDLRSGLREKIVHAEGKVKIEFREDAKEELETEELRWERNMAVSMTIVPLLRSRWADVQAGKEVEIELLVPSRQEAITFILKKDSAATVKGQAVTVIIMEPDSFIIRLLVDPLFFYMADASPHRLLQYKGRTS